jgi:pimeloyl-ACP methyl ester carboxylesterase
LILISCFICQEYLRLLSFTNPYRLIVYGSNSIAGKYTFINGIKMYYEVYGEGDPVLLIHGGRGSIENFCLQIPELSKHFRIIAPDSRAHGRTTDSDQPLSYALMASDMAGLADELKLEKINIVGWSDGGNTALEFAYAFPGKIGKMAIIGTNYTYRITSVADDGVVMDPSDPLLARMKPFLEKYFRNSEEFCPTPERFPEIKRKWSELWNNHPDFSTEQLREIKAPTLVISGDNDLYSPEQTIILSQSLPNSQLMIVPGASHFVHIEQPEIINRAVIKFLKTPFRKINNRYFFK